MRSSALRCCRAWGWPCGWPAQTAVQGAWPHLHCPRDHWAPLLNFVAWSVLPLELLSAFTSGDKHRDAWTLLRWRDGDAPKEGCLLPCQRGLTQQSRQARTHEDCAWLRNVHCFHNQGTQRSTLCFRLTREACAERAQ